LIDWRTGRQTVERTDEQDPIATD